MPKQIINPTQLAPPRGFNHAILCSGGRTLFLAGQDASDSDGRIVAPGNIVRQYDQVLSNLKAVVAAAGGRMTDIVKLNIFVVDREDYVANLTELGQIHRQYFGRYYPAMALFEISGFFQEENLIEIEGIAYLEEDSS